MDAGSLCSSIDEESERPLTTLLRWLGDSHHHDQLLATGARTASVAVVGSSGNLLNSRSGRLIDEHTVVVRVNGAPTDGFVDDVGRRTSLRMVNSHGAAD
eukprot:650171-Prymnesium_polylepis.3